MKNWTMLSLGENMERCILEEAQKVKLLHEGWRPMLVDIKNVDILRDEILTPLKEGWY